MALLDIFKKQTRSVTPANDSCDECGGFALTYFNPRSTYSSMTLSAVFAAVELISNSVAQLPIHIRDLDGNILNKHYMNKVFTNNILSKFSLMKMLVSDMLLYGNGIAYITRDNTGTPTGLIYCPKGTYSIDYQEDKGKLQYFIGKLTAKPIEPKDVIHIVKNSSDGINGKGIYNYATRTITNANNTEKAASAYFESGCAVSGILKSQKHLSKKQKQDILEAWNTAHSGESNRSIAVMPVDLDYIQISSNASESQMLETRLFNVQEVARFFNINPVLLGDLSHSSYSTIEAAQLEFLTHTLSAYIELIQDELNRKLCNDEDFVIDIDEDHILKADKSATANYLRTLTQIGILSINEARHVIGYQPIEGGDKHFALYTNLNNNEVENTNKKITDEDNE